MFILAVGISFEIFSNDYFKSLLEFVNIGLVLVGYTFDVERVFFSQFAYGLEICVSVFVECFLQFKHCLGMGIRDIRDVSIVFFFQTR